jgi:methylated-DNA-protein-cysteine methyltransferase related protein
MRNSQRKPAGLTQKDQKTERIRATIDSIPAGRVATYGQVAEEAGLPGRARMVGRVLRELPRGSELPWFRVLGAGGRIAIAPDEPAWKRQVKLLRADGVEFRGPGRVDMKRFGWQPD